MSHYDTLDIKTFKQIRTKKKDGSEWMDKNIGYMNKMIEYMNIWKYEWW